MTQESAAIPEFLQDCDRLSARYIRKGFIHNSVLELGLMNSKWFDYRFMHPTEATYFFAFEFEKVYQREYARNIDSRAGKDLKVFLRDKTRAEKISSKSKAKKTFVRDPFEAEHTMISGLWTMRQMADAMGMPYDLYISRAFTHRLNYWQQRHLPRPQTLYCELVTDKVAADWDEHQRNKLYFSTDYRYKNAQFVGLNYQNDHHEWLFAQLELRLNSAHVLARIMYDEQLLPEEKVRNRLGDEVVAAAREIAERTLH